MHFGKKEKYSPQYIGPYKILKNIGKWPMNLPLELASVHPVFHVSMLRKCIGDPRVIVSLDDVSVEEDLTHRK